MQDHSRVDRRETELGMEAGLGRRRLNFGLKFKTEASWELFIASNVCLFQSFLPSASISPYQLPEFGKFAQKERRSEWICDDEWGSEGSK